MLKDCLIKRGNHRQGAAELRGQEKQITAPAQNESRRSQPVQAGPCQPRQGHGPFQNRHRQFRKPEFVPCSCSTNRRWKNTRKVRNPLFDEELKGIGQEMSGKAPHLVKQKRLTQITGSIAALRGGKSGPAFVGCAQKGHPVIDSQGEMIRQRRGEKLPPPLFSCGHIDFTPFPAFLYPRTPLSPSSPFPLWCSPTPRPFPLAFLPYLTCDTAFLFRPFAEMPDALGKS